MAQKVITQVKGLHTYPNQLTLPEGALVQADNVIIDRDNTLEPRRGFAQYGNTIGNGSTRAKQLIEYKERLLIHYENNIAYNSVVHSSENDGLFVNFDGEYSELEENLRIKFVESNRNLYFTTADGIKKISAKSSDDFTADPGFIIDSGAPKALDVTGVTNFSTTGFFLENSKIAYRIVWGYTDANDNLILGSPSSRLVLANFGPGSGTVDLTFAIPQGINENFFYQIYRTQTFQISGSLTLDDINPGDEMNLVFEDFPSASDLTTGTITVNDIAPEDFRAGGLPLYTNPVSGDGILQANEPPPIAKDIDIYQSTVFYANVNTRARKTLNLLGLSGLVSGTSGITISDGTNSSTYTFVGQEEITNLDFSTYTGSIPTDLNGKYFLKSAASNVRNYYVWYDTTKTTQQFNFDAVNDSDIENLDGTYVTINGIDRTYYMWFDYTGTTADPNQTNEAIAGFVSIPVNIVGFTTMADVVTAAAAALINGNAFNEYDVVYTPGDTTVFVETEAYDAELAVENQTINRGFDYSVNTPINSDPQNDTNTNTDVAGRVGIRVGISRGVTTIPLLADATAAAILEQDLSSDFIVDYTAGSSIVQITNSNNGNTIDCADSSINPIGNGFICQVTQQGLGENASTNEVLLSAATTPALQIDESARSLVNIINKDPQGIVYAYYLSGTDDLPGQFLLEVRDIGTPSFTVVADNATTGLLFNPSLPPEPDAAVFEGISEVKPNRVMFAKLQQPEGVPIVNFIDVGPQDKEISRILALRESLFILKEEGVYRLTGLDGNYAVDLFDGSTRIIAPDTAVVLNNQIYCLTNQGVAVISDTGIDIISRPIENIIDLTTSSAYDSRLTSFGVTYETDRAYLLHLPSSPTDTVATQCLRYHTFTQNWTRWDISKTCGRVLEANDKLYFGASDQNFIEQERKNFSRTDYADRQFNISINQNGVSGKEVALSSSDIPEVGDAVVQTQTLTISQFNRFLEKLDLDPQTGSPEEFDVDFGNYTGSVQDLHGKLFTMYSASDENKYYVFFDAFNSLPELDPVVYGEIRDATQGIRVDVSSFTTIAEVVAQTQQRIKSSTQEFVVTYINGSSKFNVVTTRNGESTDASDGVTSPIADGFVINLLSSGFGDYLETTMAVPGDNLRFKLNDLAEKMDNDPSINDMDYLDEISTFTDSFEDVQLAFNALVVKANLDSGIFYTNYPLSEGSCDIELLIVEKEINSSTVTFEYNVPFIQGPVTIYKSFTSTSTYGPQTFGDPSVSKQVREATVMFENDTFSRGEVGYNTDLSPGFIYIPFTKHGKGDWGNHVWGGQNWGGGFAGIPLRTYIPRQKQRCRYIQCQFIHNSARERWAIFGISYTLRSVSERAYRD